MRRVPRRWAAISVVAVVAAGIAFLGVRFADDAVVYYRTPSEIAGTEPAENTMRLSGVVVAGSVSSAERNSSLIVSDGTARVTVTYPGRLPATVHEGEGVVVEGRLAGDGTFLAEEILLQHSNEYRPDEQGYSREDTG